MSSQTFPMKIMMILKGAPIYMRAMLIEACIAVFTCIILELIYGLPTLTYLIAGFLLLALLYTLWTFLFVVPLKFIDWVSQKLK